MRMSELLERMSTFGERWAVCGPQESATYSELQARVLAWTELLDGAGVAKSGEVVAFIGDYGPEACSLMLALALRECVAVPLSPDSGPHHSEYLEVSSAETVIRLVPGAATQITRPGTAACHRLIGILRERRSPGLILFSSGSTGRPKGIVQDFGILLDRYKTPGKPRVTLSFLLLDHIGGINTMLYALSSGGAVVAVNERTPEAVCRAIATHKVQLLPVSPTFLQLLLASEAYRDYDLSSLEVISYGTELMPESTLKRVHAVFPGVRLAQTYGMSEIGILKTRSEQDDSVWLKLVVGEGCEAKVVDGTLWVKAGSAMLGYLNAASPIGEDGWIDTEDLVEQKGDYIRFLGRRTDIINVGGQKVYPAEVESAILELPEILEAAVHGEANPFMGQVVVALVRPRDEGLSERELRALIQRHCRARLAAYKVPVKVARLTEDLHNSRFKTMRPRSQA